MASKNKSYIKIILLNFLKIFLRIVLFPFVIAHFFAVLKKRKRDKDNVFVFNMSQIDTLSGVEFENFLKEMFEKLGYAVEKTKASHDYGADLLITKNGKKAVVQAKCYAKAVGIKAVQEIIGAKQHYAAEDAFVATNNYFSKDAEVLAVENGVKLIDRNVIEKMVAKYQFKIEKKSGGVVAFSQKAQQEINQRFHHMI